MDEHKGIPAYDSEAKRLREEALNAFRLRLSDVEKSIKSIQPQLESLISEQALLKATINAIESV